MAATDNRDHLAEFSNYGMNRVDVAAPGVSILSTIPGNAYLMMSGTSMATPHVAGVAALLWSQNPSWSYAQIKERLIRSSDPVRSLNKKVVSRGRVNAYNAIHGVLPVEVVPSPSQWVDVNVAIETPHPYVNGVVYSFPIHVPNAKFIRVVYDSIDTEENYDFVLFKDSEGEALDKVSGARKNYTTDYVSGSDASIFFYPDATGIGQGFKVSKVQVVY